MTDHKKTAICFKLGGGIISEKTLSDNTKVGNKEDII